jgi:hypothetical protein
MQDKRPACDWRCSALTPCLSYQIIRASSTIAGLLSSRHPGSTWHPGVVAVASGSGIGFVLRAWCHSLSPLLRVLA